MKDLHLFRDLLLASFFLIDFFLVLDDILRRIGRWDGRRGFGVLRRIDPQLDKKFTD